LNTREIPSTLYLYVKKWTAQLVPGDTNSACCERVGRFEEGMEDGDYLEFLAKFSKEKSEVSHSVSKSESDSRSCINTFLKKLKMSLYIYILKKILIFHATLMA
jgi:hypothetical protein